MSWENPTVFSITYNNAFYRQFTGTQISSQLWVTKNELRLEEPRLKITDIYLVLNAKKQANENT